jgi:hypothetical protein
MAPIKMSWHAEGGRLASGWVESEAGEPYNPAWMQSSYPSDGALRSIPNQSSLSPFEKPAFAVLPNIPTRFQPTQI